MEGFLKVENQKIVLANDKLEYGDFFIIKALQGANTTKKIIYDNKKDLWFEMSYFERTESAFVDDQVQKNANLYGISAYNPFFQLLPIIDEHISQKSQYSINKQQNEPSDTNNNKKKLYITVQDLVDQSQYYKENFQKFDESALCSQSLHKSLKKVFKYNDQDEQTYYDFNDDEKIIEFLKNKVDKVAEYQISNFEESNMSLAAVDYKKYDCFCMSMELLYEHTPISILEKVGNTLNSKYRNLDFQENFQLNDILGAEKKDSLKKDNWVDDWGEEQKENNFKKFKPNKPTANTGQETKLEKIAKKATDKGQQSSLASFFGKK